MAIRPLMLVAVIGIFGMAAPPCRAQGHVEHLEPPALERGKTTRLTLVGSQLGRAENLWTSLPAGILKATPVGEQTASRAVLDVTVAADAPVGICGVRLATRDGLANACLLLIDDMPVRPAPKVDAQPSKVPLPAVLWGPFKEAMVERFAIDMAAGQRVGFEAVGNRLGKDVDPLIIIRDSNGRIVAERDNDPGLYFDCRFEHTFAQAGTYTVELRDARFHGAEHGFYVLRMGRFPAGRVALPMAVSPGKKTELRLPELGNAPIGFETPKNVAGLFFGNLKRSDDQGSAWVPLETTDAEVTVHQAPGDTMDSATPAKVPGVLCGVLSKPGTRNFYRMELAKGQRIVVRAEARAFNSPADLEVAITDAKGKELRRAGENQQKEEVVLDFNAGTPGVYGLTVRDVNRDGGPAFAYRLEVRSPRPEIQVSADVEGLTVPRGERQPMPLTVTRTDFSGKIALSLVGAPPGIQLSPTAMDAGVQSLVCHVSAAPDAPLGIHTFQIQALPVEAKEALPTLVRTQPLIDKKIVNVDLIPHALRDDQRRLPPSLTDRFALHVTPPAPFTVDLPEPLVTLGRYQHVEFPVVVKQHKDFAGPLTFDARGGQIAPKEEGRTRVYAAFAPGKGSIHSKILTNLAKHRVEVTATGVHEGRRVSLTRTFDLEVRSAFTINPEAALSKLEPGRTAKVRLTADRLKNFDAEVTLVFSPSPGFALPEKVVIPKGQSGVDLEIKVETDRNPGRHSVNFTATAEVSGLEEEQRGRFEIEVVKTKK